ncbi:MAG: spermidine synthase, partial [Chloroflexota bacterium]
WAPPVAWGALAAVLFAVLLRPGLRVVQVVALIALVFALGRESIVPGYSWSPYYRVEYFSDASNPSTTGIGVNGIIYQAAVSVADRKRDPSVYFLPYQRAALSKLDNVLIVGAGSGTDTAIALDAGARHVDAVEIDPRLYQLGVQRHPDHPYADPRVTVTIDDARAFLERTNAQYDLILFAMPDAMTLVSGQSSLRLESYLFTVQAVERAKEHLRPTGAIAFYNYYREDWLIDRLAGTLQRVFGHPPCVDSVGEVGRLAAITLRVDGSTACPQPWRPTDVQAAQTPVTDDYPFLYLNERSIPAFYLLAVALILIASSLLVRAVAGPFRSMRRYLDLFFMGAAFLLLETKSVVQFALLFGTTWFVNALVFTGVLVAVLLAIEVARRVTLPNPAYLYGLLLAAVGVAWMVPVGALLGFDPAPRFVAAVVIWFTPIFIANLVFAERFRSVEASNIAFGANLLGAMVGGVLEYVSLLTGYQALLILVALLYGAAFVAGPVRLRRADARAPLVPAAR